MTEKVYIAGLVSDGGRLTPEEINDNIVQFGRAALVLIRLGYEPVTPTTLVADPANADYVEAMRACLHALADSNGIYLLRSWKLSTGARVELEVAQLLRLFVIGQCDRCETDQPGRLFVDCLSCGPVVLCGSCTDLHRLELVANNSGP
jgi:hypothetical protein